MSSSVVSIAAVRVSSVAVALNLAGPGQEKLDGRASNCGCISMVVLNGGRRSRQTYSSRFAGTNLTRESVHIARIAHHDDRYHLSQGSGSDGNARTGDVLRWVSAATKGIVHDLSALSTSSVKCGSSVPGHDGILT